MASSASVSVCEIDLAGAGDQDRFDQPDELVAGRRTEHPHARVLAVAQDDDRRRLVDAVFGAIVDVEDEVLFLDRDLVVEPRDLVEHLLGDRTAFGSADRLCEQQQRDGLVDRREMLGEDLLVLSRQAAPSVRLYDRCGRSELEEVVEGLLGA